MPNGKPGDHPITDIMIHKMDVFGDEIDGLIKELVHAPGYRSVEKELGEFLLKSDPRWQKEACDRGVIKSRVKELIAKAEASQG